MIQISSTVALLLSNMAAKCLVRVFLTLRRQGKASLNLPTRKHSLARIFLSGFCLYLQRHPGPSAVHSTLEVKTVEEGRSLVILLTPLHWCLSQAGTGKACDRVPSQSHELCPLSFLCGAPTVPQSIVYIVYWVYCDCESISGLRFGLLPLLCQPAASPPLSFWKWPRAGFLLEVRSLPLTHSGKHAISLEVWGFPCFWKPHRIEVYEEDPWYLTQSFFLLISFLHPQHQAQVWWARALPSHLSLPWNSKPQGLVITGWSPSLP